MPSLIRKEMQLREAFTNHGLDFDGISIYETGSDKYGCISKDYLDSILSTAVSQEVDKVDASKNAPT